MGFTPLLGHYNTPTPKHKHTHKKRGNTGHLTSPPQKPLPRNDERIFGEKNDFNPSVHAENPLIIYNGSTEHASTCYQCLIYQWRHWSISKLWRRKTIAEIASNAKFEKKKKYKKCILINWKKCNVTKTLWAEWSIESGGIGFFFFPQMVSIASLAEMEPWKEPPAVSG